MPDGPAREVIIVGYRDWARDLARLLAPSYAVTFLDHVVRPADHQIVFLAGWSEIVPLDVYYQTPSVYVLHPSALPAYRGGSPIQHQIMDGLDESAVTIFRLDEDHPGIDTGPVAWAHPLSLDGSLSQILRRIATIGAQGVAAVTDAWMGGHVHTWEQGPSDAPPRRRRRPEESEITAEELATWGARRLYDKIRALQPPYPQAWVRSANGVRLYIAHGEDGEDGGAG